ncbi:uncharacterized protein LOC144134696 isoform X2 [Amblyomma americanum]
MAEKQTATCSEHRQSFRNQSLTSRFHWFVWIAVVAYAMGHFATSETEAFHRRCLTVFVTSKVEVPTTVSRGNGTFLIGSGGMDGDSS